MIKLLDDTILSRDRGLMNRDKGCKILIAMTGAPISMGHSIGTTAPDSCPHGERGTDRPARIPGCRLQITFFERRAAINLSVRHGIVGATASQSNGLRLITVRQRSEQIKQRVLKNDLCCERKIPMPIGQWFVWRTPRTEGENRSSYVGSPPLHSNATDSRWWRKNLRSSLNVPSGRCLTNGRTCSTRLGLP